MPDVVGREIAGLIIWTLWTLNCAVLLYFQHKTALHVQHPTRNLQHTRGCARCLRPILRFFCLSFLLVFCDYLPQFELFPFFFGSFGRSIFAFFRLFFFVFVCFSHFCRFLTLFRRVSSCFCDCSYASLRTHVWSGINYRRGRT